jgi:trimethylamine--corrinoid protein Co-methyltransferase
MLTAVLAGAVGIGTVGAIENAVTFSPVQLVIDNELAAYVRRAVRTPIEVSAETLAVDMIDRIGPGGNFLSEMHTAENFRKELHLSPLFGAQTWQMARSQAGMFDTAPKAAEIARSLWRRPESPVLTDEQIRRIDKIVARATKA